MFKTITNKQEYIHAANVRELPITYDDKMKVNLFGNEVLAEKNEWLWHLHLKLTNACNAKCYFCVEQNSKLAENAENYVTTVDAMLTEMEYAGILYSVSLTGGEPLLFSKFAELCNVLKQHDIKFLTINTNGTYLKQNINLIDGLFDFVDISRHAISDDGNNDIFKTSVPTVEELKEIKSMLKQTKMRMQCVLCSFDTVEYVNKFVNAFRFADDISFRKLMTLGEQYGVDYEVKDDEYYKILEYAFNNFELIEQTIQDYYVYEIWNWNGMKTTFSYSNMKMLLEVEQRENKAVCREFIIHPDCTVSGSWNPESKVLFKG